MPRPRPRPTHVSVPPASTSASWTRPIPVTSTPCGASPSRCRPARSSPCSARTAPASPPRSRCSPRCRGPTRARRPSPGCDVVRDPVGVRRAHRRGRPEGGGRSRGHRHREPPPAGRAVRPARRRRCGPGSTSCSTASAWARPPGGSPAPTAAGCSAGSTWPWASSTGPRCCSSTSPPPASTPSRGPACGTRSAGLAGDEGLTVLLTTHYLEEADRLADRVAIVDRGRVVAEGTPDALKAELRGDAIQLELADARRSTPRSRPRSAGIDSVVDLARRRGGDPGPGRRRCRGAAAGARRARAGPASPSPPPRWPDPRSTTCTCVTPAAPCAERLGGGGMSTVLLPSAG